MDIIKTNDQLKIFLQILNEQTTFSKKRKKQNDDDLVHDSIVVLFRYLRAFIFVQIKKHKLIQFQAFCNIEYKNIFDLDKTFKNINVKEYYKQKFKDTRYKEDVLNDKRSWWLNNRMICNVLQHDTWNTSRHWIYKEFIENHVTQLVSECSFILNPRDHPLVSKNGEFPYKCVFLKEKYTPPKIPVFSHYVNDEHFKDFGFPTCMDLSNSNTALNPQNQTQKNMAVFRGSATGAGLANKNQRVMLCLLAKNYPNLLDCKLTSYNYRDRIDPGDNIVTYMCKNDALDVGKHNFMSIEDQCRYKYNIVIDGWVAADRLGKLLKTNSLVLLVDSMPFQRTKSWFYRKLIRNIHYISISADLSDLIQTIEALNRDPERVCQIILNANRLYDEIFTKPAMARFVVDQLSAK